MTGGGDASSAVTLAPSLRWDGHHTSAFAYGSLANYGEGAWSTQGSVGASFYGPRVVGLRPEIGVDATGTRQGNGRGTDQWSGSLRLHYLRGQFGVWGGGTAGRADDSATSRAVTTAEIGAWKRTAVATMVVTVLPTWLGDTLRHTDLVGALRLERGRLDATASAGWRTWSQPDTSTATTWAGANVALWFSDHLAVVASASSYPTDWAQGLPSGRFATLGLRLSTRRPTMRRDIDRRRLPPTIVPVVPAFKAIPIGDGRWTLRIRAPAAQRVEVMGDFTNWQPIALVRDANGRWVATFVLTPGVHRFNVRLNGGAWGVPPGLPVLKDDFGGVVAALIIES